MKMMRISTSFRLRKMLFKLSTKSSSEKRRGWAIKIRSPPTYKISAVSWVKASLSYLAMALTKLLDSD